MATTHAHLPGHLAPPTIPGPGGFVGDSYGVLDRLLIHHREQGGTLAVATGIQGCGKTTLFLGLARVLAERAEVVVWRGRDLDAWHAYPGPVRIWANYPLRIDRIPHDASEPEPWDLPVHQFTTAADLIARLEPGVLNVVYALETKQAWDEERSEWNDEPTRFWGDFVFAATKRARVDWLALFLDEVHEVWGDRPQGEDWHHQRKVRNALADFRKSFSSAFFATHHYDETDDAILKKIQYRLLLRGAAIPPRSVLREKNLVHHLRPGEALIEQGNFAVIEFPKIDKPPYQIRTRKAEGEGGSIE